ncbi:MAG: 50S ribosomal protein L2 [Candidatus Berkelbacteria bacterium]|nr:50S ribosomal protein L2 [Candidatus Berkelbacteria bacterium]
MALKLYKPTTQSRRKMSVIDYSLLTKKSPEKSLTRILKKNGGRDNTGQISVRHQGGESKRKYRTISQLTDKMEEKAEVIAIEYDPNRSAFIALIKYPDNTKVYILAWEKVKVGDIVIASDKTEVKFGNRMRLKNIPTGTQIFDVELQPFQGGKFVKSAGSSTVILAKDAGWVQVKMPSSEIRKVNEKCFASIGQVSNISHSFVRIGKAGRMRHMGIRPSVRGKAMNPNSHPHGGGEGQNSIGLKYPKTPWGKIAIGGITRKKKKYSDKFIIKKRKK